MGTVRNPQTILVTGGSGFIGSAFIRYLLADTTWSGRLINLDALTYAGNPENLSECAGDPRYEFVHGDIRDSEKVADLCKASGVDCIVNFAAESHVDRSILGPKEFVDTNVMGTFALLEVVRGLPDIHFHHVSTDEVYGSLGKTGQFLETTPYDPQSPYSASKAASDHFVRAYVNTYGISATISNCSNNYGPYQFPEKLIPLMTLNCLEGKPLPVYGDGTNVRDWLYVDDHAEAIWTVVRGGASGETYNVGGDCEMQNIEIVHAIIGAVAQASEKPKNDLEALITYVKDRPGHDWRYAIDFSKLKSELGWEPKWTFERGIAATVTWYLENQKWLDGVRTGEYRKWLDKNYRAAR